MNTRDRKRKLPTALQQENWNRASILRTILGARGCLVKASLVLNDPEFSCIITRIQRDLSMAETRLREVYKERRSVIRELKERRLP
jgi:hypothetical protein